MQIPVSVRAALRNTGNVPATSTLNLAAVLNGVTVYTASADVSDLQVNGDAT